MLEHIQNAEHWRSAAAATRAKAEEQPAFRRPCCGSILLPGP